MNLYKNRMEQLVALQNIKDRYKSEHMHFLRDLLTKFYSATKHPNVPYENAMVLLTNILISKGNNYELVSSSIICDYCFYEPKLV